MHKHPHSSQFFRGFSLKENRFIFEFGGAGETTPDTTPEVESGGEEIRNKEEDLKTAQVSLDAKIQNATSQVEDLPPAFRKQVKDNVAQYCAVSYDQIAKKDGNENMNRNEHTEWHQGVMTQVNDVLSGITGGAEAAADDREKKEEELKSLEDELKDLEGGIEDIEHEEYNLVEENLKNPDTLPGELEKYKNRATVLQKKRVEMSGKMEEVTEVKGAFDKQLEENNAVAAKVGVGAGVAGGVAVALAWAPGVNIIALGAAAAAAAAAAATKMAYIASEKKMAAKANEKVQVFKDSYDEQRGEFAHVVRDMRKDGEKLHEAAPDIRGKIEGSRDAATETLSEGASETSEERAALQQQLEENTAARDRIAEQKQLVLDQQLALQDSRSTAEKNEEKVDANKHGLGNKLESVNSAILEIENSGVLKGDNAEAKAKYDELLSARDIMFRGVEQMGLGKDQLKNFLVDTAELDPKMDEQFAMLQQSDETLVRTGEMLSLSEASLSERILRIEETLGVVETEAATKIEQVNELEGSVTSGVAEISIENIKAQTSVEMEWTMLKDMKVEAPAFLTSVANSVAAPFEATFKGISYVLELGKDIPVLGSGLSFLSGVSEAAGDITGGLAKMAVLLPSALVGNEDGIAMAKGLGNVALLGTTEGSREAWVGMGKAIVAADMWEKDGAKAAGKAAANIAMFFIPGAGPGAGIARSTYAAARTAGAGVLRSATRAAVKGAKTTVVETGKSYGSIVKGAGRKVRGAARGIRSKFRRGKGNVAETGAEAGAAVESTAATTESTAARGSALDDAGNAVDDAASVEGGKIEGAVNEGLDKFVKRKSKTLRRKDVKSEIAETDALIEGGKFPDEIPQLKAQKAQLESLEGSIAEASEAKALLRESGSLTDGMGNFCSGKTNTISRTIVQEEISAVRSLLENPALDDAARLGLETDIGHLNNLYRNVDRMQVARGLTSKPLPSAARPASAPAARAPATATAPAGTPASAPTAAVEATAAEATEAVAAAGRAPRTAWERYGPQSWNTRYRAFNRSRRGATATSEAVPVVEAEAVTASRPSLYSRASAVRSRAREMWNNRPRPIRRALDARNTRRAERAAKNSRYADRLEKGRGARADNRVFLKKSRANKTVQRKVNQPSTSNNPVKKEAMKPQETQPRPQQRTKPKVRVDAAESVKPPKIDTSADTFIIKDGGKTMLARVEHRGSYSRPTRLEIFDGSDVRRASLDMQTGKATMLTRAGEAPKVLEISNYTPPKFSVKDRVQLPKQSRHRVDDTGIVSSVDEKGVTFITDSSHRSYGPFKPEELIKLDALD